MNKTTIVKNLINTYKRSVSTSACLCKRNFDKFPMYEFRLTEREKEVLSTRKGREENKDIMEVIDRGVKPTTLYDAENDIEEEIQEMIPEIIVPDLTGFNLKPYVSYKVPDVEQSEFTPQDLFHAVYSKKIIDDFKSGKLDESGNPKNPSEDELLDSEEAILRARRTGSDAQTQPFFMTDKSVY